MALPAPWHPPGASPRPGGGGQALPRVEPLRRGCASGSICLVSPATRPLPLHPGRGGASRRRRCGAAGARPAAAAAASPPPPPPRGSRRCCRRGGPAGAGAAGPCGERGRAALPTQRPRNGGPAVRGPEKPGPGAGTRSPRHSSPRGRQRARLPFVPEVPSVRSRECPVHRRPGSLRSEGAPPRRSSDPAVSEARPGTSPPPALAGEGPHTRAGVEVLSRASLGKESLGNAGRGSWDPCDPAPGRVGRNPCRGSRVAGAPGRPGDAVPRPPVCPLLWCSSSLHEPSTYRPPSWGGWTRGCRSVHRTAESSKFPFLLQKSCKRFKLTLRRGRERPGSKHLWAPLVSSEKQTPATRASRGNWANPLHLAEEHRVVVHEAAQGRTFLLWLLQAAQYLNIQRATVRVGAGANARWFTSALLTNVSVRIAGSEWGVFPAGGVRRQTNLLKRYHHPAENSFFFLSFFCVKDVATVK